MEWTVEELIKELQKVEDKSKKVRLSINDVILRNFHINNNLSSILYLSNYGEKSYKATDFT